MDWKLQTVLSDPIFFGQKASWNFGKVVVILSVIPIVSYLLNGHWVFSKDRKQTRSTIWDRIASVIWHYYILNMLMLIEQILKKRLMSFHQKKFVPSSFSNQFLYQTTWVIYFESCKESELVNSTICKGNLSLIY